MRTTIKYDEVTFFQDETNKVTVAVINGCTMDAYTDYLAEINAPNKDDEFLSAEELLSIPEQFLMPSTIKVKSTCQPCDEWNSEIGKRQAFFKLCRTYNKIKKNVTNKMIKYISDQDKALLKMLDRYRIEVSHYDILVHGTEDTNES